MKYLIYFVGSIFLAVILSFFSFSRTALAAVNVNSCGNLITAGETYVLTQDVSSDKTCFVIKEDNITLDLGGHTVTYGNYPAVSIPNGNFESGNTNWNLSNAPQAGILPGTYLNPPSVYSGSYSLKFSLPAGSQFVRSNSQINFSGGTTYALTAMVYNMISDDITMTVELEGTSYSVSKTGRTWRGFSLINLVFRPTSDVSAYIKLSISGSGLSGSGSIYFDDIQIQSAHYYGIVIPTYDDGRLPDIDFSSLPPGTPTNIVIKNGSIVQGSGNGYESHNIYFVEGANTVDIHDINATVQGMQSSNIFAQWSYNNLFYNNTLTSNVQTIVSRDNNDGAQINLSRTRGANFIYNNLIKNGPHDGIYMGDYNSSSAGGSQIYGNTIQMKTRYTNGFAVAGTDRNALVHDNIILNVGDYNGRGIHVAEGNEGSHIYNNYVEVSDIPNNQEYGGCAPPGVYGIQLENHENSQVTGNTIIARTGPGLCGAIGVRVSSTTSGAVIDSNTISAIADSGSDNRAYAFSGDGSDLSGAPFTNNIVSSNSSWFYFGYWAPSSPYNLYAEGNTFSIGDNPIDFIAMHGVGTTGVVFVDNVYGSAEAKAALESDSIRFHSYADPDSDFTVKWHYDPTIKSVSNLPISGAIINIQSNGSDIYSGNTGADGKLADPPALVDFINDGGTVTDGGTYQVTISVSGYDTYTESVDPTEKITKVITLSSSDSSGESCLEQWECGEWSACDGGTRSRVCSDVNNCGTSLERPAESETCQSSSACLEDWVCTDWSSCQSGIQTRTCLDRNLCGTEENKPTETFDCSSGQAPATDTVEPNTQITSAPAAKISSRKTSFSWQGTDDQTMSEDLFFSYQLDNNGWSVWTKDETVSFSRLRNGSHSFYVRARDESGNVESSPAEINFIVEKPQYLIVVPNQGGGPQVRIFNREGYLVSQFFAFEQSFRGGISVTAADLGGDGTDEIIVGAGPGRQAEVKIFRQNGTLINSFLAYPNNFQKGVNVAAGDFDGDGIDEIVVAPMVGGGPNIRIFGYRLGSFVPVVRNFMAYNSAFRGGVSITTADVEGDGIDEIITAPQSAGGPQVRMFGIRNKEFKAVTLGFMAYNSAFRGGINVASGNFNIDIPDEIITAPQSAGGPQVRMFGRTRYGVVGSIHPGFFSFAREFRGGVSLASFDVDMDGYNEIAVGVGSSGDPLVRVFGSDGTVIVKELYVFNRNFKGGIRVAVGE